MVLEISSARFEGSLNVDLNEITMNLVPFPRMHYLVSSQTPLYSLADIKIPARRLFVCVYVLNQICGAPYMKLQWCCSYVLSLINIYSYLIKAKMQVDYSIQINCLQV